MTKLSLLALLFCGCAHHKPCATIPPPTVGKIACNVTGENEELVGLVCSKESMGKFFGAVTELKTWADNTYGVCSK